VAALGQLCGLAGRTTRCIPRQYRPCCSFRGSSGVGPWDPTGNATAILDHFAATWTGRVNFSWAMGNEPDLWKVSAHACAYSYP